MKDIRRGTFRLASVIIIFEMLVTSLGYCGHLHDHGLPGHACGVDEVAYESHVKVTPAHSHSTDKADSDHSDQCACKTHCGCLGGFIGDLPIVFEANGLSEIDRTLSVYVASLIGFYPMLERPPQAAA